MDLLCFFLSRVCYAFICALLSPSGKGLTFWLSFVMSYCLSLSHWYPGSGVILGPDLCTLTYFDYLRQSMLNNMSHLSPPSLSIGNKDISEAINKQIIDVVHDCIYNQSNFGHSNDVNTFFNSL